MTKRTIIEIAIVIFGLYFLLRGIELVYKAYSSITYLTDSQYPGEVSTAMYLSIILPPLFYFLIGFLSILRSKAIAGKFFSDSEDEDLNLPDKQVFLEIAFIVIGAVMFVILIPSTFGELMTKQMYEGPFRQVPKSISINLSKYSLGIILSLLIITRARPISRIILKLNGLKKQRVLDD